MCVIVNNDISGRKWSVNDFYNCLYKIREMTFNFHEKFFAVRHGKKVINDTITLLLINKRILLKNGISNVTVLHHTT